MSETEHLRCDLCGAPVPLNGAALRARFWRRLRVWLECWAGLILAGLLFGLSAAVTGWLAGHAMFRLDELLKGLIR